MLHTAMGAHSHNGIADSLHPFALVAYGNQSLICALHFGLRSVPSLFSSRLTYNRCATMTANVAVLVVVVVGYRTLAGRGAGPVAPCDL